LAMILILCNVSCYKESTLLVKAEFTVTIENDNYTTPVNIVLENNSTGADFYKWTFDEGTPSSSSEKQPPKVTYNKAGTYKISLEAWNDTERDIKEFTFSVDSAVTILFDIDILVNDFAPADIKITNNTLGASTFLWEFEGGVPSTSTDKHPANIHFATQGEHTISLTVSNGREIFSSSKTITLDAPLNVDFDVEPSFDDFDYEVPFKAQLVNKTVSGLTYSWTCTGATIENSTAENTNINIQTAGTYTIELTAANGKETKSESKQITVKPNTNLYILNDVKFGIKSAESTLGCFYSLPLRTIIKSNDVDSSNGNAINLVFFGLDMSFNNCYFTSPHRADLSGFVEIPNATQTFFINRIDETSLSFSSSDFDNMTNDNLLQTIDIKGNSNTTSWFTNLTIPNFVLFETNDGIKGVIKVKGFVSNGYNSYILTDIKVQKQ